jgi:hypothetical protein
MKNLIYSRVQRVVNSPAADRLQTRGRRRLIIALVLLWQPMVIAGLLLIRDDRILPLLLAVAVQTALFALMNMSTRGMYELGDAHLDEYQRSQRDAGFRKAYYFGLLWVMLIPAFAGFVQGNEDALLYVLAFSMLGFFWGLAAPQAAYAWNAPDDLSSEG